MKLSSRFAGGLAVACALAVAITGCSGGGQSANGGADSNTNAAAYTLVEDGKLIVASDLANPPLDYVDEGSTEAKGFEVDLMKAVADKLGLELEYLSAMKFDAIIPLIKQGGKADLGVSNFTVTDERKEEIDFTEPYLNSNQGLVTKQGAEKTTEEDLNDASVKVAVQSGSTGADWAKENLPNAQIVALNDPIEAITGVSTGLYQAAVADLPVMEYLCKNSFTDCQISQEIATGEQYAIVASKDNPGLTEAINGALAELDADGTLAELQTKWFGREL